MPSDTKEPLSPSSVFLSHCASLSASELLLKTLFSHHHQHCSIAPLDSRHYQSMSDKERERVKVKVMLMPRSSWCFPLSSASIFPSLVCQGFFFRSLSLSVCQPDKRRPTDTDQPTAEPLNRDCGQCVTTFKTHTVSQSRVPSVKCCWLPHRTLCHSQRECV